MASSQASASESVNEKSSHSRCDFIAASASAGLAPRFLVALIRSGTKCVSGGITSCGMGVEHHPQQGRAGAVHADHERGRGGIDDASAHATPEV